MNEFMLEKQSKYFSNLPKEHYEPHELAQILGIPYSEAKDLVRGAKKIDEGYLKLDIILNLMGGTLYSSTQYDIGVDEK